jgi:cephalosporin hydroxylase
MKRGFLISDGIFPKNSIGAEIGIFMGVFASSVVNKVKPKMYHMIDPWKYRKNWAKYDYKGKPLLSQEDVEVIYQDICRKFDRPNVKIHRDYSYNVVNEFEDEYFDFLYIDGNHNYHAVLQDLTLYYPKIKVGGVIAGDDWKIKGDRVKRAVIEFTKKIGVNYNIRANQYWFFKEWSVSEIF